MLFTINDFERHSFHHFLHLTQSLPAAFSLGVQGGGVAEDAGRKEIEGVGHIRQLRDRIFQLLTSTAF